MSLYEIAVELRLLAGELRGHDELDQHLRLDALADELDVQANGIRVSANRLAKRALPFEAIDELQERWT